MRANYDDNEFKKTLKEWSKLTPIPPSKEIRVLRRLGKEKNLIKGSNK